MLECVLNLSSGDDESLITDLAQDAKRALLDIHTDREHNRSVFTLAGPNVEDAVRAVARLVVDRLDLASHTGAHPRVGVLDVVPFIPLGRDGYGDHLVLDEAIAARNAFGHWAATELALPCFFYGSERSLPDIRRTAFHGLVPDVGPSMSNERSGACCVGARPVLVAYNLWLTEPDLAHAQEIARALRSDAVRSLAFFLDGHAQVSCNLIAPWRIGPSDVFDLVEASAPVERCELVGLIPEVLLESIPEQRWSMLDLSLHQTIEYRLSCLQES